jgi:DNA-binding SARP family transcriptional activator
VNGFTSDPTARNPLNTVVFLLGACLEPTNGRINRIYRQDATDDHCGGLRCPSRVALGHADAALDRCSGGVQVGASATRVREGRCAVRGDDQGRLRFCVLGPLQVFYDGAPVRIGGAQQRAVLAFLLVERQRAVSMDQIADALWAERPPAGHAATIQTYIYHLRETLEPDRAKGEPPRFLVTEPGGYRLDIDPGAIDEGEFECLIESGERLLSQGSPADSVADLDRALSLWRGTVLADLSGFDFAVRHGGRLDELRWRAIESKIDAELALGRHGAMLANLNSFADSQPLREHLQAQRILALYRAGRQADALSAFRSVRARLREELGIEPSAELTDLHQSMLNQDAALLLERPTSVERTAGETPNELWLWRPRW